MAERSEEQIISRLFALENEGQADQRAQLSGQRYLSLIQDPSTGKGYVFRHGFDETEGAEVPEGTEFWDYPDREQAERAYAQLLREARQAGEVVEEDSDEEIGDSETGGAEIRDQYSADEDDDLVIGAEEAGDQTDTLTTRNTPN
jgi:hypothetical protein